MNDTTRPTAENASQPAAEQPKVEKQEEGSFLVFLIKLAVIVLVFRSVIFAPFNIPSGSMMPRLLIGDYLLASKWSYGLSRYSVPLGRKFLPGGRILARQPARGDIVIFKAPPNNDEDYIKRVIGLPGDQIQMRDGVLFINGAPVKKVRIADFVTPVTQNMIDAAKLEGARSPCVLGNFEEAGPDGGQRCRFPQFRETLPNGVSYNVLDFGPTPQDDTPVYLVPDGMMFLMGDDRDDSMDSRFPATPEQGVGMVPQDNLVGKATIMMWSTDGSSSWIEPWTWFTAARWNRVGGTF